MSVGVSVDTTQADFAAGFISGIGDSINTDRHINYVIDYVWVLLQAEFDLFLDELARNNPHSFMHVYEWGDTYADNISMIGDPEARLWTQTLLGRGRSKIASFKFKASKKPVPVDPILLVPGPNGEVVKEGIHIFYMKATVMEYGLPITVTPQLAKYLAFVNDQENGTSGGTGGMGGVSADGSVRFSDGVSFTAGGGKTEGKFTDAFRTWWSGLAETTYNDFIKPTLEADLAHRAGMMKDVPIHKMRKKSFSIAAGAANGRASYEDGKDYALTVTLADEKRYIEGARARRLMKGDDTEIEE